MQRDTAGRALADAYTAARLEDGMTPEPGHALDTGRSMARWLHEHGFRLVETHYPQRVVTGIGQDPSTIHLDAVPDQEIPPSGAPVTLDEVIQKRQAAFGDAWEQVMRLAASMDDS